MKKLSFYALELGEPHGGKNLIHQFEFKDEMNKWIDADFSSRYHLPATTGVVRRLKRRMALDESLKFPIVVE